MVKGSKKGIPMVGKSLMRENVGAGPKGAFVGALLAAPFKPFRLFVTVFALLLLALAPAISHAVIKPVYIYKLSDFQGVIPYSEVMLSVDETFNEVFAVHIGEGTVSIFNHKGMETFIFGEDGSLGRIYSLAVRKDGNMVALSYNNPEKPEFRLLNYRGEPVSKFKLKDPPPEFEGFCPNRIIYKNEKIYMVSHGAMKVAIADENGKFIEGFDFYKLTGIGEENPEDAGLGGFAVDGKGTMYFTLPVPARAYTVSPEGVLRTFGKRGGAPGRFGVPFGIEADEEGNIYIADKLKSVVMIFDKDFKFIRQFGGWGRREHNLISPSGLVILRDQVLVSQIGRMGVSVFRLSNE